MNFTFLESYGVYDKLYKLKFLVVYNDHKVDCIHAEKTITV